MSQDDPWIGDGTCSRHHSVWFGGDETTCPYCKLERELNAARVVIASLSETEAGAWKDAWEEMRNIAGKLEAERDRLLALLRECLPLVEWHESTGYLGYTVAPRPDLSLRLKAALEGR